MQLGARLSTNTHHPLRGYTPSIPVWILKLMALTLLLEVVELEFRGQIYLFVDDSFHYWPFTCLLGIYPLRGHLSHLLRRFCVTWVAFTMVWVWSGCFYTLQSSFHLPFGFLFASMFLFPLSNLCSQDNPKIIYAKPPNKFSWIEIERLLEGLHWTRRKTFDQNPFDAIEAKYTNWKYIILLVYDCHGILSCYYENKNFAKFIHNVP